MFGPAPVPLCLAVLSGANSDYSGLARSRPRRTGGGRYRSTVRYENEASVHRISRTLARFMHQFQDGCLLCPHGGALCLPFAFNPALPFGLIDHFTPESVRFGWSLEQAVMLNLLDPV